MENFNFKNSTRLIFGKDTHEEAGKYIKDYSKKILLHYEGDGDLIKKLGIYDKFGQSGKANELLEKYELTAAKLVSMVKENM